MFWKIFAILFLGVQMFANEEAPQYLYKILSKEDWIASQNQEHLQLPAADEAFIHFSLENQVERIVAKYWNGVPEFFVLKIDPKKLPGKMVFETNPGGSAKYYHLYEGAIPHNAIVESKSIHQ